jgi:hypothetical protein
MAFLLRYDALEHVLLVVAAALIVALVAREQWLTKRQIVANRGDPAEMADAGFFQAIEHDVIKRKLNEIEDLADGYLRVFASEVPYVSILLLRTLTSSPVANKSVLATDLTRDPKILLTRREYLATNRNLVKAGGSVQRIFVCAGDHLVTPDFARDLLVLVDQHRAAGVVCGLAVREQLRPTEAVDFVVVGQAAVLVEEEQGDVGYGSGRSTVHFKRVAIWRDRFTRVWESNEYPSASEQLTVYEAATRPLLSQGSWSDHDVRLALDLACP